MVKAEESLGVALPPAVRRAVGRCSAPDAELVDTGGCTGQAIGGLCRVTTGKKMLAWRPSSRGAISAAGGELACWGRRCWGAAPCPGGQESAEHGSRLQGGRLH